MLRVGFDMSTRRDCRWPAPAGWLISARLIQNALGFWRMPCRRKTAYWDNHSENTRSSNLRRTWKISTLTTTTSTLESTQVPTLMVINFKAITFHKMLTLTLDITKRHQMEIITLKKWNQTIMKILTTAYYVKENIKHQHIIIKTTVKPAAQTLDAVEPVKIL